MFCYDYFGYGVHGMGERHKWFLKNLSHARENNWLVITHEHLERNYEEYAEHCEARFYDEFEMRKLGSRGSTAKSAKDLCLMKYSRPRRKRWAPRTEFLAYLFQERYVELEECLTSIIDEELQKEKERRLRGILIVWTAFGASDI